MLYPLELAYLLITWVLVDAIGPGMCRQQPQYTCVGELQLLLTCEITARQDRAFPDAMESKNVRNLCNVEIQASPALAPQILLDICHGPSAMVSTAKR